MIGDKLNAEGYKKKVYSKFLSFSEKSPLLLDIKSGQEKGRDGIKVSIRSTGESFFYEWDFNADPKEFIHKIKLDLEKRYPTLTESLYEEHQTTSEEIMGFMERGYRVTEIPRVIRAAVGSKSWRIDKVVVWRDIVILVDIPSGEQFRYKLNTNLVLFLKKYRSGEFKSPEDAGTYFFERASLLNKIEKLDSQQ